MPGVKDTPWHSRAAALCAAVPPCLPFRLVLCLHGAKRLLSSAAVVSLSMEKAPLALAAWRCPALSCPVPPRGCATCPSLCAWGSVAGDNSRASAVCLVLVVVAADGDSRGEKGENVCSDVLQSVALLWYPAHSGASNSLSLTALSGCSDDLGCSHHQDPPGNLSFVSPVGFSWLMPLQSPGSLSWCVARRGCGGRMAWSGLQPLLVC